MTGVITWVVDCGDGVCIEREQPSTALKPMTHFTTFDSFSSPDVYHPEFQPEPNGFESPHGTYFAGHDPLTGLDTGSRNDRITAVRDDSPNFSTGAGGGPNGFSEVEIHFATPLQENCANGTFLQENCANGTFLHEGQQGFSEVEIHFCTQISGTAGPGGTTYMTENLDSRLINHDDFLMVNNIGSTSGPGGTSYMTGVDHLGQFGHEADHFTNFAMPVGDFI